ncbi:PDDEXK-like protein of unknown function [Anaerovirgula multivorans]|uniref:Putative exodeoxyribonuclease 8 PDDEXK-like domain-containing protein n=1 Tax=Anaerovirgula multivorans TaxID=312168 RepID=A0A239AK09_9FIRM|nr:PD-(D/E)XK nuclease-like domain-containing protein [Anaerovirgula multivorans]SNR96007.1 PDDEXK-like protein of unknown function [Anaerovirgula multivorans]
MKLLRNDYFSTEANRKFMSVSQYKAFLDCEARTMAELNKEHHREEKECFIEGKYLHAWNEGKLEEFKLENPSLNSSRGETKGQLKANYKILNEMIKTLETDKLCMMALEGEKEVVMTAELFGIPWKIMIDNYNPSKKRFSDLKAVQSLHKRHYNHKEGISQNFVEFYGYTTQIAVYSEVIRISTSMVDYMEGLLVAATKENPPDKAVISFDVDTIEHELMKIESNIERIIKVKNGDLEPESCGRCDFCKSNKKLTGVIHYSEL